MGRKCIPCWGSSPEASCMLLGIWGSYSTLHIASTFGSSTAMESCHWQVVSYLAVQKQGLLCAGFFQDLPGKVMHVLQEGEPQYVPMKAMNVLQERKLNCPCVLSLSRHCHSFFLSPLRHEFTTLIFLWEKPDFTGSLWSSLAQPCVLLIRIPLRHFFPCTSLFAIVCWLAAGESELTGIVKSWRC